MSKQILQNTIHQSFAKTVIGEVLSKTSRYYFAFGKTTPWNSNENQMMLLIRLYMNQVRKSFIFIRDTTKRCVTCS